MTHIDGYPNAIPSLHALIASHESILSHVKPARVAAIALDSSALNEREAADAIAQIERETGLPAADPVRSGAPKLWSAIAAELKRAGNKATAAPVSS